MTVSRIVYFVLLIVACAFWVMYRGALSLQLVMAALAVPVVLFLLLLWQKHTLSLQIEPTAPAVTVNAQFQILLRMTSRCPIPIHYVTVALQYAHSITGEEDTLFMHLPGMGRSPQIIQLPFSASCCGKISIGGVKIKIYDPLSLFSFSVSCNDAFSLLILPQTDVLPALPSLPDTVISEQSQQLSQHRRGDDPSEIVAVDAYVEGDVLSHVHWKLTAKSDEMIIKHFSQPLPDQLVLFADYRRCGNDLASAMKLHHVLSVCASLSQKLVNEETPHHLCWLPMDTLDSDAFLVDTPEQLMLSLHEMLSSVPFPQNTAAVLTLDQLCATRLIYCTAMLDEQTVLFLSALATRCQILVLYICNGQPAHLPQDADFLCYPVICADHAKTEVVQHG